MSKKSAARWMARLERMRVDVDAVKGRAPHKPLLLLAVLSLSCLQDAPVADRVILITLDGVCCQEMFQGLDLETWQAHNEGKDITATTCVSLASRWPSSRAGMSSTGCTTTRGSRVPLSSGSPPPVPA